MIEIIQRLKESKKNLFVGMAGPGAGKSYTFKQIVQDEEYKSKKILILSFINKLVDDLQTDFKDFENVTVSTLHSFAKTLVGDVDIDPDLDRLLSDDYYFIYDRKIDYEKSFHEYDIQKEQGEFYKKRKDYYKHEKNIFSFNSIIYITIKYLELNEKKIPSKYDLILIDEFQDFNRLEYEFIKLLNKKAKVVVVGDDNQSLYLFKKAKPEQIRQLYMDENVENFSLDYCRRCTKVIVEAVNNLVKNAKSIGLLKESLDKKFLYPEGQNKEKDDLSRKFPKIDFISAAKGDLLFSKIEKDIKDNLKMTTGKKRILILVPSYLKQTLYDGLIKRGFNIVEFEMFSSESCNKIKHKDLGVIFKALKERKTDNLALRKILQLYLSEKEIKSIIINSEKSGKKIWNLLSKSVKKNIENDINIFTTVRSGNTLKEVELKRFSELFSLRNIMARMVKGFEPVSKGAIEIEMTTTMSSKGLSADYVYYVGIDDEVILDKETKKFSNHSICEFLVGITRAKEKLTLVSLVDKNPKILRLVGEDLVNLIN